MPCNELRDSIKLNEKINELEMKLLLQKNYIETLFDEETKYRRNRDEATSQFIRKFWASSNNGTLC